MFMHIFQKIRFAILKKRIKKNPFIGKEETNGLYDYRQGGYSISYRIIKENSGKKSIEWISLRRRLGSYEKGRRKISKTLFNFWRYQGWLIFFRPPIIFLLITSIVIFYFGLIETEKTKVERFKWIVASVIGVNSQQIEYIGDGSLEISAQRKTAVDRIYEPIRYTFSPLRWLFSSEAVFVTRWRGEPYGYATHPVVYNERGDVWINKQDKWRHGNISGNTVKWDIPQGTGIREGKVTEHEISTQDKKRRIEDK